MGGMTRLLLLLWAGVTVGSVVDLQKRILGGHECLNAERLYHVQLRESPSDTFVCGGSLISDQWILTAAHCWSVRLYAVVGVHPGPGIPMNVRAHFFREHHDIMLLEITNPNPNTIQNHYIRLPNCTNRPTARTVVQIAGHADTVIRTDRIKETLDSETLLCANSAVVDCTALTACVRNNPQLWARISAAHMLCYQRPDVDTSGGDSGGGVVYNGMIYGVHSFGGIHACRIAAGSMDVCADRYMDWIVATTGIPRPRQ